jgi:hypothetical protein
MTICLLENATPSMTLETLPTNPLLNKVILMQASTLSNGNGTYIKKTIIIKEKVTAEPPFLILVLK